MEENEKHSLYDLRFSPPAGISMFSGYDLKTNRILFWRMGK
jgi:hypothetical protein